MSAKSKDNRKKRSLDPINPNKRRDSKIIRRLLKNKDTNQRILVSNLYFLYMNFPPSTEIQIPTVSD